MKTLAITGTSGFLGSRAAFFLKKYYNIIQVNRDVLDITNEDNVLFYFDKTKPDIILHSAAISDIKITQDNPKLSNMVNEKAPCYIAKACANIGAKLVFTSSDQVYTGNKECYALKEDVALNPQNLYAQQKLNAEQGVSDLLNSAVSLRLTWMYDVLNSNFVQHNAFAKILIEAAKNNQVIDVNINRLRSVTYINNVIENLNDCFSLPGGVYNFGSENELPFHVLYKKAANFLGINENIIQPFEGEAQNILIDTSLIKQYGIAFPTALDGFKQAFAKQ